MERIIERMEKLTVCICSDEFSVVDGHGVLISRSGLIATVCHIFFDIIGTEFVFSKKVGDEVEVQRVNGKSKGRFYARITRLDQQCDIALLQIERSVDDDTLVEFNFSYAKLALNITNGQILHMVTTSDGSNFEMSKGTIEFEQRLHRDINEPGQTGYFNRATPLVQVINLHGIPGYSGAPVFNSRHHLVGLYSFSYGRRDFLIHPTLLDKFCVKTKPKKKKMDHGEEEHGEQTEMAMDGEDVDAVADDEQPSVVATNPDRQAPSRRRQRRRV